MKISIVGLLQVGKKKIVEILTSQKPTQNEIAPKKPIKGIVEVKEPRFDMLAKAYKFKKEVIAKIELLPKPDKDSIVEVGFQALFSLNYDTRHWYNCSSRNKSNFLLVNNDFLRRAR